MAKYKYQSTQYNMSIRSSGNINAGKIGQLSMGVYGYGDEVVTLANGEEWFHVMTGGSVAGWVAVIYLGKVYGTLEEIGVTPPPVDPPAPVFPQSFKLTYPDGNTAEYLFSKVL